MIAVVKVLLIVVQVISGLLLIGLILIQKSKSQGMGLAFGGAMGETLFGARAGNVLTRATVILTVVFLLNTTALSMLSGARSSRSVVDLIPDRPQPVHRTAPHPITTPAEGDIFSPLEPVPDAVED